MDNKIIEELRKIHEIEYRQIDSSAIVVVALGEIDYETNDTIKMYKSKGQMLMPGQEYQLEQFFWNIVSSSVVQHYSRYSLLPQPSALSYSWLHVE